MSFLLKQRLIFLFLALFVNTSFGSQIASSNKLPSKDYFTDDLGNVYMHINILGHVKKPGTYMIYENADIYTILAQAGGPLRGAKLKSIKVHNSQNQMEIIDLKNYRNNNTISSASIEPNSTIYVDETSISFILYGTNIASTLLNLLSIYLNLTD